MNTPHGPDSEQSVLSPLPALRDIARAQFHRIVVRRKGLIVLVGLLLAQSVTMAAFGIVFGVTISVDRADGGEGITTYGWTRLSNLDLDPDSPIDEGTAALAFVAAASVILGLFMSLRVWRGESPSNRGYHWAMPVDHRTHDLLRVAAGAVWLIATVFALVATTIATGIVANTADRLSALGSTIWLTVFLAPLIAYFLSTPAALRSESGARWIFGSFAVLGFGWSLSTAFGFEPISQTIEALIVGKLGIITTLVHPLWANLSGLPPHPDSVVVLRLFGWLVVAILATFFASKPRHP